MFDTVGVAGEDNNLRCYNHFVKDLKVNLEFSYQLHVVNVANLKKVLGGVTNQQFPDYFKSVYKF